jgi:hypothetical protein
MYADGADIRALILTGRADDALRALEAHFPAVLAPVPAPDAPPAPEDANAPRPFVAATSLEPAHVALNLRIMAFVEDVRAEPLSAAGSPPSPMDPPADPPATTPSPALDPERAARLIARARKLQRTARALPRATDRAVYGAELARVCALLAYVPASRAPAAQRAYLGGARRAAVAAQVNAAILRACVAKARGHSLMACRPRGAARERAARGARALHGLPVERAARPRGARAGGRAARAARPRGRCARAAV